MWSNLYPTTTTVSDSDIDRNSNSDNNSIPIPRSSSSSVCINNKLYVFGGENIPRKPIDNNVYTFDIINKHWHNNSSMCKSNDVPQSRVGHNGCSINSTFYVYGGRTDISQSSATLDDFWSYNTDNNQWSRMTEHGTKPVPLSYFAMCSDHISNVYIFGGCSPECRQNILYQYNITTSTWHKLTDYDTPNSPTARGGCSICYVNDIIYVMFGYDGKTELDDMYTYDLNNKQWSKLQLINSCGSRSVTDIVYLSDIGKLGSIFVTCGECSPSSQGHESAGKFLHDTWLYDIDNNTWVQIDTDNEFKGRGWSNTTKVNNNSVIVFGGLNNKDQRMNDVWYIRLENAKVLT